MKKKAEYILMVSVRSLIFQVLYTIYFGVGESYMKPLSLELYVKHYF